jgi:enoyl-CoA hydratase/3-hydroxyacyl-CoA dehydrogenase
MLRASEPLDAEQARLAGIIDACVGRDRLLQQAIARVGELARQPRRSLDAPVDLEPLPPAPASSADGKVLSATVLAIMDRAIVAAAAAPTLADALEVGYRAFGESACAAAAREGIEAFLARRAPDFKRTG